MYGQGQVTKNSSLQLYWLFQGQGQSVSTTSPSFKICRSGFSQEFIFPFSHTRKGDKDMNEEDQGKLKSG